MRLSGICAHVLAFGVFILLPISCLGGNTLADVKVITVDTRRDAMFSVPGVPGVRFINCGFNMTWHGMQTKTQAYVSELNARVVEEPESIVILTDGGDVAFGGCDETDLLDRYQTVVHASGGAQVVAGGDHWVYPNHTNITKSDYTDYFGTRKDSVLSAFGVHDPYDGTEYAYVNSGFIMGPVQKVLDILMCMTEGEGRGWVMENGKRVFHDQLALARCMFLRPQDVAIDYSGLIVLDYNGLPKDSLIGENGIVHNTVYNKAQCFIHFNGWCPQFEAARLAEWGLGGTDDDFWTPLIETSRWCHGLGLVGTAQKQEEQKWILSRSFELRTGLNQVQVMLAAAAILVISLCLVNRAAHVASRAASTVELAPLVGQETPCE